MKSYDLINLIFYKNNDDILTRNQNSVSKIRLLSPGSRDLREISTLPFSKQLNQQEDFLKSEISIIYLQTTGMQKQHGLCCFM